MNKYSYNKNTFQVLGINYNNINKEEALKICIELLTLNEKKNIFFLNADYLYKAQKDKEYNQILKQNTNLLLGDGIGLKLITKHLGGSMIDNCNGTDFMALLLKNIQYLNPKIFFLGGQIGVAKKAANHFKNLYPSIQIVGTHHGYWENDQEIIKIINSSNANILLVGLGAPKQEKWIINNRDNIKATLCFGVGAFFDFYSGRIKRAPKIIRFFNIEWFWRFLNEPKRLFKRYFINSIQLLIIILKTNKNN